MFDLHREAVIVASTTTASKPGPNGTPVRTEVSRTIEGCNVQQVGITESLGSQELVTSRYRVSCGDLHEWVRQGDQVTFGWSTDKFTVEGRPAHFRGGALDHTEFIAISRKGA